MKQSVMFCATLSSLRAGSCLTHLCALAQNREQVHEGKNKYCLDSSVALWVLRKGELG